MRPAPRRNAASKPRYTYGRERSFLDQDEATTPEELEDQQQPSTLSPLKRLNLGLSTPPAIKRVASGGAFRSMLSSANSRQELSHSGESNEQGAILKTSHELREAGQSHRFKDEIEYILDGVKSKDMLKVRRTSCLDLVRSMLKPEFTAHIRTHQYMPVIFEATHDDHDPDTRAFRDLMTIRGLIPFLYRSLEMDMDPMATTPTARQEMTMFNDFKDVVRQSGIIQKGQKVLVRSMALANMNSIVSESISLQDEDTLSLIEQNPKFLSSVMEILIEDLAWIKQPLLGSDVSLPDVLDIDRVENCLCILERLALVSKRPTSMLADNTSLFPLLMQLITLCRAHAFQHPQRTDSLNLMLHVLRLLINVTNGFEPCSTNLSNSGAIQVLVQNFVQFYYHTRNYSPEDSGLEVQSFSGVQPMQWTKANSRSDSGLSFDMSSQETASTNCASASLDKENSLHPGPVTTGNVSFAREIEIDNDANGWYDILLLSLGLLINMLETSPHCREHITSTAIGLDCMTIGNCFRNECQCEKSTETLERLVQIYNTEAIISDMTENQVLAAHLALLIGCIVEGSVENEARLYQSISGHSLGPMLVLLEEFIAIHKAVQVEQFEQQDPHSGLLQLPLQQEQGFTTRGTLNQSAYQRYPKGVAASCEMTSMTEKAAETERSFLKVIEVLQAMETKRSHITWQERI